MKNCRKIKVNLGEIKNFEMPLRFKYNNIQRGSFSKILFTKEDGTLIAKEWLYCREYFQDESKGINQFLFCHSKDKIKNIFAFINKIENVLKINKFSLMGPTQRKNVSWIKPSNWWLRTSMKRSLFTALLRCGQRYNPQIDNFEEALFSYFYTKDTKQAVKRFLQGNTKYTGKKKGWYNQFKWGYKTHNYQKIGLKEINKLLIKPS